MGRDVGPAPSADVGAPESGADKVSYTHLIIKPGPVSAQQCTSLFGCLVSVGCVSARARVRVGVIHRVSCQQSDCVACRPPKPPQHLQLSQSEGWRQQQQHSWQHHQIALSSGDAGWHNEYPYDHDYDSGRRSNYSSKYNNNHASDNRYNTAPHFHFEAPRCDGSFRRGGSDDGNGAGAGAGGEGGGDGAGHFPWNTGREGIGAGSGGRQNGADQMWPWDQSRFEAEATRQKQREEERRHAAERRRKKEECDLANSTILEHTAALDLHAAAQEAAHAWSRGIEITAHTLLTWLEASAWQGIIPLADALKVIAAAKASTTQEARNKESGGGGNGRLRIRLDIASYSRMVQLLVNDLNTRPVVVRMLLNLALPRGGSVVAAVAPDASAEDARDALKSTAQLLADMQKDGKGAASAFAVVPKDVSNDDDEDLAQLDDSSGLEEENEEGGEGVVGGGVVCICMEVWRVRRSRASTSAPQNSMTSWSKNALFMCVFVRCLDKM